MKRRLEDDEGPAPAGGAPARRAPRPPRVVSVAAATVLVLLIVGVVALFSGGVRQQVALSTTRKTPGFVELYFPGSTEDTPPIGCTRQGSHPQVDFVLVGHLGHAARVAYEIRVTPQQGPVTAETGTVSLAKDFGALTRRVLLQPEVGPYVVQVLLPAYDQQLRARCPAPS